MNWWGRIAGLLVFLLVVLFSCEEDINTIGIKSPNAKFRVNYTEIDIPSSVILLDQLATYNKAIAADGVQRFLVGQYQDPEFGTVRAEIYTQISPPIDNVSIGSGAVMDSLVLQLKTDFYHYGSSSVSDQTIQVYELADTIKETPYYNISKVAYKPGMLAEKLITIDPVVFDQNIAANSDNVTTNDVTKNYRVILDANFAKRLFETVQSDTAVVKDFTKFTGKHKGLAIIPTNSDQVFGINPSVSATTLDKGTKLILYYTEGGTQKTINFVLYPFTSNPVLGFSSIKSNRAGTVLQPLINPFKDFFPVDNRRYIQSGIGIVTKLDFTKFFEYMDTVASPVLNSAELVFENGLSDFPPPSQFQFRALNDKNQYMSYVQDTVINGAAQQRFDPGLYPAYLNSITFTNTDQTIDLRGDLVDPLYVHSDPATATISGFLTQFFQDQYAQRKNEKRIKYCALLPLETQFRKSVNRVVLTNNIKLRVYYTTAVIEKK